MTTAPTAPLALLCLAATVLLWPIRTPGRPEVRRFRSRLSTPIVLGLGTAAACAALLPGLVPVAPAAGIGAFVIARRSVARAARTDPAASWEVASTLDLMAAGLNAGLDVEAALRLVLRAEQWASDSADRPPPGLAELARVQSMLAVGADTPTAWQSVRDHPDFAPLATAAARSSTAGTKLALAFTDQAAAIRGRLLAQDAARNGRAAVIITAPLGLCFLPAFLCLGLAPALIGLFGSLRLW